MWIESTTVRGFGCICNRHIRFPRGQLCLIIDENERGKSTLMAAILTALCGFPTRRTPKSSVKPIEAYRPWSCKSYAVELEFQANGKRYHVLRDFAENTFIVRDLRTNRDVTAECHTDLAYHFLRLPREDYERIAIISGKEVSYFNPSTTIREKLMAVIEGSQHSEGAERALEVINSATYHFNSRDIKPKTAIARISDSIDQKSRELRDLDSSLEAASQDVQKLEELFKRRDELERRIAELDSKYVASRLAETTKLITSAQQDLAHREELLAEMKQLEPYADFPVQRRDQISSAAIRLREIENQIAERQAEARRIRIEIDELRSRMSTRGNFAAADRDDLLKLYASREKILDAQAAIDNAQRLFEDARSDRHYRLGKVLLTAGASLLVVALVPWLVGAFKPSANLALALAALFAVTAGLSLYWRGKGAHTAAKSTLQQAKCNYQQLTNSVIGELSLLGVDTKGNSDLVVLIEETIQNLENHLGDKSRLDELERLHASVEQTIADLRLREKEQREIIDSILEEARIHSADSIDQALLLFKERCSRCDRYWQIKNSELPSLESRILSDAELSQLKAEAEKLRQQLSDQSVHVCEQSSFEVETDRQNVRRELNQVLTEIGELERKIGAIVENYRRRYSAVEAELETLRYELKRACRFAEALELAERVLGEVVSEARLRWADVLNRRASEILPHLNPDYHDLRFDDSLEFTVRRVSDDRIIEKAMIDTCLSTGAKDQIYLAVRLACCRELSESGEALPIILDDALVAFDDERFETGLRYLAEQLSTDQQVILLTCHRARHERLSDREWFRNRVKVLNLN